MWVHFVLGLEVLYMVDENGNICLLIKFTSYPAVKKIGDLFFEDRKKRTMVTILYVCENGRTS